MKKLFVVVGLVLSIAAQARPAHPMKALISDLTHSLIERKALATGQPLLKIEAAPATAGSEFNAFIRPVTDYAGSYVVIDATLDGSPVTVDHPAADLWIYNTAQFEKITSHVLSFTVSLESACQADQISAALTSVQQQIQSLQTQIANTTDANQLAQLNSLLSQQIALQSQLTTSLVSLKNPIGTQIYSFSVTAPTGSSTFPSITAVNPSIGSSSGGAVLTITGTNFASGSSVFVGGIPATSVTVNSATQITATAPAFSADGVKDVRVDLPLASGQSEPKEAVFQNAYYATSAQLGGLNIPVAITGAPQSVALGSAATLSGSQSVGPTGHVLAYAWSLISKPAGSALPTGTRFASTANAAATPDYPGNYVYQLVLTDASAGVNSAPSLTVVTATLANATLTATAPAITLPRSSAASSQITVHDANSPYLHFSYYITQQPLYGPVSVSSTGLVTYHELATNTAVLIDFIGVTVLDNASPQNSYTLTIPVTITPSTTPTYANASCSRQSNTIPFLVYCGASNFLVPNGSLASALWNYGDGTPSQPMVLTGTSLSGNAHYFTSFGTFYEQLSVTDNIGAQNNFLFARTFLNSSIPTAKFSLNSVSGATPLAITANATASSSPVNSTLTYRWNWGDGTASEVGTGASFATRSHSFSRTGTFTIILSVTDTLGNYTQSIGTVYAGVAAPATGSPPNAFADITSNRAQVVGTPFTFNGSTYSMDPNPSGSIVSYVWNYNDFPSCPSGGCTESGANVSHAYPLAQSYFPSLTVTNALGGVSSSFIEVMNAVRGFSPRAAFSLPRTSGVIPFTLSVDGTSSYDYDGHIVSYTWTWGDSTADTSGATASHTYTSPGTFFVDLTVVDDDGNSNFTAQMITVTPTARLEPKDDISDGTDDGAKRQILTNACAQGSGPACDELAAIYSANGDALTSTNLRAKACQLGFQADCGGKR